MGFTKFIKGSSYARCVKHKYKSRRLTPKTQITEYDYDSDSVECEVYVKLEDIAEFQDKGEEGILVLVDRATISTWVLVTDDAQKAILKRYIEMSVVSDSRDIIAAISDMKEFICHLATVTNQEQSKKRARVL